MNFLPFAIDITTIAILSFVLIFSVGIVWRVEKKLDLSYKFFVVAAMCFTLAEITNFFVVEERVMALVSQILRLLGSVCFLASVLLMRDIVRNLDHEKEGGA